MEQRLWIVDNAVAYVESGHVTLQIDKATRHLPRNQAFEVADKIWFANQMRELGIARLKGETKTIPLTDRRRRSSLRLGGGFMITQGKKLIIPRRHMDAPRPGQLCECGGVFEYIDNEPKDINNDYVASLLKEGQELVVIRNYHYYLPQLAPSPSMQIGFMPPGSLSQYNKIIENEIIKESQKAKLPIDNYTNPIKFWIKILEYENAVTLEYSYSPKLSVEVTAEIDTSSLECVGVLSIPEDLDTAVISFADEEISSLEKNLKSADGKKKTELKKHINNLKKHREKFISHISTCKENNSSNSIENEFQYWDSELGWNKDLQKEGKAVHRDIHIIDTETGIDHVWMLDEKSKANLSGLNYENFEKLTPNEIKEKFKKIRIKSDLWSQLSATKLGPSGTAGRFATEKLEKAIKMHCPFPRLQPLITL